MTLKTLVSALSRAGIVLGLIVATALPPVAVGYYEVHQARAALSQGRLQEAAQALEHAALLLFWRNDLWEQAGKAALASNDGAYAARLLERAGRLSVAGWRDLAAAYRTIGRPAETIHALERGLDQHGPHPLLLRELALEYHAQEDYQAELATWQAYLTFDRSNAAVHHRIGLLLSLFHPDAALAELDLAAQLDAAYESEAQTMRSALYLASHESEPSKRLVIIGRGLGLLREWRLAHLAFQQAVQLDGQNAEAWAWLGEAQQHLGQEAGPALEQAVTLDPRSAQVRALYGLYWKRQNHLPNAIEHLRQAVSLEPQQPAYLVALADAYALAGDLPPALEAYRQATLLAPNEVTYWRLLATFCAQYHIQALEVGVPAARTALALAPDQADSYDLLGWVYLIAGLPDQAEQALQTALHLDERHAAAHLHLAMVYLETRQWQPAREHLTRAQSLDPQGVIGRQAEQLLRLYFP